MTISSRLAIGTVQFGLSYGIANQGGQVSRSDAASILRFAKSSGINTIDTAIAYGDSEACLGEFGVYDLSVITKLPFLPEDCLDVTSWVSNEIYGSLERLGINSLNGLLLHHPNQLFGRLGRELIAALNEVRKNGLVSRIGVSIYAPQELELIYPLFLPDIVQAPLSLVDRRLVSSGWLRRLSENGVAIHTRSCFLQGLLLMDELPMYFNTWSNLWIEWQRWKKKNPNQDLAACLSYPLSFSEVERVIIGIDSLSQLKQLLEIKNLLPIECLPNLNCEMDDLINPSNWP